MQIMSYELYSLLGISPDSSVEEIKALYRSLAKEHYSKRYQSDKERLIDEERFKKITSAYHIILSDKTHGEIQGSAVPSGKKEKETPENRDGETVDHEEGRTTALEYFDKGKDFFDNGEYKNAVMQFKNAIRFYPEDGRFYDYLGLTYARQKLFKMAVTAFEKALSIDINSPLFQRDFGLVLEESGDLIKAKVHFTEALRLAPEDKISSLHLEEVTKKWRIVTKQKVSVFLYIATSLVLVSFLAFIYYSSV